jgi:hypothetical protein
MPKSPHAQNWHFLLLGFLLIFLSAFLWYGNWQSTGLSDGIHPENYLTIVSFIVGFFILGIAIFWMAPNKVVNALIVLIMLNLLVALGIGLIFQNCPTIYHLLRPAESQVESPEMIGAWADCFLVPFFYALQAGLILLWLETMVLYMVRGPKRWQD